MKSILLVGALGQLGRALNLILDHDKYKIIATDIVSNETTPFLDITNESDVANILF